MEKHPDTRTEWFERHHLSDDPVIAGDLALKISEAEKSGLLRCIEIVRIGDREELPNRKTGRPQQAWKAAATVTDELLPILLLIGLYVLSLFLRLGVTASAFLGWGAILPV
jgi:hypothetical protein